jgi:hypothetical protein
MCFNEHFRLLKTIYVHLLVYYLNKLQNARCNDKYSCFGDLCALGMAIGNGMTASTQD